MLVDGAPQASHLDPLTATPERNKFLKTVVPFLATLDEQTDIRLP